MVLFKTPSDDSTGKAHVLEHILTNGDWAKMRGRSLNTFMNAFTGNDYTVYPFSTKDPQDFRNLLKVYLEMVFFKEITEDDFK